MYNEFFTLKAKEKKEWKSWTNGYNLSINQENENVRLITGNIEALAEEEGGLDCNYNRHPSQCEIYVGAKGKVKLLGGSIISAGVDG